MFCIFMRKILLLSSLTVLVATGCGSNPADATNSNTLVNNDFETLAGWLPEPQSATLSRNKAHSGRYAMMVDAAHEYSMEFKAPLGQLHDTRIQKIKVSAWALVPTADASASLVVTVGNPDPKSEKPLLWESLELKANGQPGKWVEVSKVITIPSNVSPSSPLGIYLWRSGGNQTVYLDDLRVTMQP